MGKGQKSGVGWNQVRKAERKLAKYESTAGEKRHAQHGSRELRRKWELILRNAGLPGTRMRKRDSVTGAPLGAVAQKHGKTFPGPTPEPTEPNREDRFDRWAFDHVTKQHHSVKDICAKYLDLDDPSGIQGRYSYAIPRREAPEWAYFDSFLQILITQYAGNPAEAAMRAACLYLAYRCGYTDKEIAERLSGEVLHERKGAVTQGQVKQCLRKAEKRAEELWPSIRDGLRKEGPTVAQKMLQRFLESKMHCMPRRRWEPQRVHPLHAHAIGAGDTESAYGKVEFSFISSFDEETGRDFERAIPTLTHPDPVASEAIEVYGNSEAEKFDIREHSYLATAYDKEYSIVATWPQNRTVLRGKQKEQFEFSAAELPKRGREEITPPLPMEVVIETMGPCVLWTFSDAKSVWRSQKDSTENLRKQLEHFTLAVDSKKRFKSKEWLDELPRNEDDSWGELENEPWEQDDNESDLEDAA